MIEVKVEGVDKAIDSVADLALKARRQETERRLKLENAQLEAEIHQMNAKTLLEKAHADREQAAIAKEQAEAETLWAQAKKIEAEAELVRAEAAKKRAEAIQIMDTTRMARVGAALDMINKVNPGLSEKRKLALVMKLLPDMNTVFESPLELLSYKKPEI